MRRTVHGTNIVMDTVLIHPGKLNGQICVPPSKSVAHRMVICASLADGISRIENIALSEDITATANAMRAFGAHIEQERDALTVRGLTAEPSAANGLIDCNESGSTIRFTIPLSLAFGNRTSFTGKPRLLQRPLDAYFAICEQDGIAYQKHADRLVFDGQLRGGDYTLPGNISSQYISGMLLALPLLPNNSILRLDGPLESKGYVDLTLDAMAAFGVSVEATDGAFAIQGGQTYCPADVRVEGDFSQAAFFLVADALGSRITIDGLLPGSQQGDRAILDILARMGCEVEHQPNGYRVCARQLTGAEIDVSQIPDLVPILAVLACAAQGTTRLTNAARLRIKESDRLNTTATELAKLGANITEGADSLTIVGTGQLRGGACEAHNDHRIAMALAVASTICTGPVSITGSGCVKKSYANFWQDFKQLGGITSEK